MKSSYKDVLEEVRRERTANKAKLAHAERVLAEYLAVKARLPLSLGDEEVVNEYAEKRRALNILAEEWRARQASEKDL